MPESDKQTYYDVLDVSPLADDTDIQWAYRRWALFWHPDRGIHHPSVASARLQELNEAYDAVKTRQARRRYNTYLRQIGRFPPLWQRLCALLQKRLR